MTDTPRDIEALIDLMSRLPGLGPRSARRAVLAMLKRREGLMAPLAQALAGVARWPPRLLASGAYDALWV